MKSLKLNKNKSKKQVWKYYAWQSIQVYKICVLKGSLKRRLLFIADIYGYIYQNETAFGTLIETSLKKKEMPSL